MYIIYDDSEPKKFKSSLSRADPNKMYLHHYQNLIMLQFLANDSKDGVERHQARKEMLVCERKLAFWRSRYGFNQDIVSIGCEKIKRDWNSSRSK